MRELSCQELVELVTDFFDGALDAETERLLLEHIEMCSGCGPYLDQFRQTVYALGDLTAEAVPDQVRDTVLNAFRSPSEPVDPSKGTNDDHHD